MKGALSERVDIAAERPDPPLRAGAGEGSEFVRDALDAADRFGAPLDVAALAASGS